MLNFLVEGIATEVIERGIDYAAGKTACYRSIVVTLPSDTSKEKLLSEIKKISESNPRWKSISNPPLERFPIFLEKRETIIANLDEKESFVTFFNNKEETWVSPWYQFTIVLYREDKNSLENKVYISSYFIKPQMMERGILTKNCETVLQSISSFLSDNGKKILKIDRYSDAISRYDKTISIPQFIIGVIIGMILIYLLMVLFFQLIK